METMTAKLDLAKTDRNYYSASLTPEIKDFDSYYYLSMEGQSAPDDSKFLTAIEAIYGVAYGIKFLCKGEDDDFVVPKMECHWYIQGGPEAQKNFTQTPRKNWCWKIVIRMPDFVESHHFFRSLEQLRIKKPELEAIIEQVRFELINEGKCAQILHIGSWDQEQDSLERLFNFMKKEGLKIVGYHKEIYLSDWKKIAEDKKKTILRYQVL